MATERKPVAFNVDDMLEKEMWEYVRTINFSGWVKEKLKPIAMSRLAQRGVSIEELVKRK